ncbi:MAG: hypothetical protein GY820_38385 [Gammaproteobacteria bacterium]|nr:hypothetical protein [Gammaproteobacteria bacterium]
MALIIEDGTEVTGANSYTTDAELVAYAAARGYTIPATEAERDILQIKSMDYLASLESSYKGVRVTDSQALSFPRTGVDLNGYLLASDEIPQDLKNAQMELAFQVSTDEVLINETIGNLASFNVQGVYSETYGSGGASSYSKTSKANAYLNNLLKVTNQVIRV